MAITIDTLGRLRVCRDGEELSSLPRQSVRCALLLFLTVEGETTRDAAMGLLWPDKDPDRARGALNQTLYELRKGLGDSWVQVQGDFIRVDEAVIVDAVTFRDQVEREEFGPALDLYEGRFLAGAGLSVGAEFEHWCERQTSRLATLHRTARRGRVEELYGAGNREAALKVARTWWELDPLEDEAAHWVIRLLAELGHQTQAIQTYERHAATLMEELEVTPLDETRELVRQVREGEVTTEGPPKPAVLEVQASRHRFGRVRAGISSTEGGRWLGAVVGGLALLWTTGFLATRAYDVKVNMPAEYMPSASSFIRVGIRALMPSLFVALVALVVYVIVTGTWPALSLAIRRIPWLGQRIDSWGRNRPGRWSAVTSTLQPATIGHLFFLVAMALSWGVLFAFRDMFGALWSTDTRALSVENGSLQYTYALVMTFLIIGLLFIWRVLFARLRARGSRDPQVAIARWGTLAWIVILTLIMAMPWRLHWEEHPRVLVDGDRAYVLAEDAVELVVFRPETGTTLRFPKGDGLDVTYLGTSGWLFEGPQAFDIGGEREGCMDPPCA